MIFINKKNVFFLVVLILFLAVLVGCSKQLTKNPIISTTADTNTNPEIQSRCLAMGRSDALGNIYEVKADPATKKCFLLYKNSQVGEQYDQILSPAVIGTDVYYLAESDNVRFVVLNGKKIGKEYNNQTKVTSSFKGYVLMGKENGESFLVYDGVEYGRGLSIWEPVYVVTGKLAFFAGKAEEQVLYFDGKIIGQEYDKVTGIDEQDGKVVLSVQKDGNNFILFDGKEYGKEYDYAYDFRIIDGKPAFVGMNDINNLDLGNRERFVIYGDRILGGSYQNIAEFPTVINNQIIFIGSKWGPSARSYLVIDGVEHSDFDGIISKLYDIDGELVYIVTSGTNYTIRYKGKEIPFDYWKMGTSIEVINSTIRANN